MKRKQFTFYESFYRAIRRIRKKSTRADVYDAICAYALTGQEPDWAHLEDAAAIVMDLILPNLRTAMCRADAARAATAVREGVAAGYHPSTTQVPRKAEDEGENEGKWEKQTEGASPEAVCARSAFDDFWDAYPRKAAREAARRAFEAVDVPLEELLSALEKQRRSAQWTVNAGRYIPYPATWLREKRWLDELAPDTAVPQGASGVLGEAELAAIRRVLEEE